MKKRFSLLVMVVFLTFALCACGASSTIVTLDDEGDAVSTAKTVDERKCERSDGIREIDIQSNVPVTVSAENTCKNVEAHLYGTFVGDGNPNLLVTRSGNKILIVAEVDGMDGNNISIFSSNSVVINSCGIAGVLNLDIMLPEAEMFETISIESKNDNIDVTNSVNAREIKVDCKNGNVDISATVQQLTVNCKNGNIDVDSEAQSDISLDVTSENGNVDVSVGNIGTSKVFVESENGSCKNKPLLRGRHTAYGNITTKNGNVIFK